MEEIIFKNAIKDETRLTTLSASLTAINMFIEEENNISTWPINRSMIVTVMQSLVIPILLIIIEKWDSIKNYII